MGCGGLAFAACAGPLVDGIGRHVHSVVCAHGFSVEAEVDSVEMVGSEVVGATGAPEDHGTPRMARGGRWSSADLPLTSRSRSQPGVQASVSSASPNKHLHPQLKSPCKPSQVCSPWLRHARPLHEGATQTGFVQRSATAVELLVTSWPFGVRAVYGGISTPTFSRCPHSCCVRGCPLRRLARFGDPSWSASCGDRVSVGRRHAQPHRRRPGAGAAHVACAASAWSLARQRAPEELDAQEKEKDKEKEMRAEESSRRRQSSALPLSVGRAGAEFDRGRRQLRSGSVGAQRGRRRCVGRGRWLQATALRRRPCHGQPRHSGGLVAGASCKWITSGSMFSYFASFGAAVGPL